MPAPVLRMKLSEIRDCYNFKCRHGHNGLSHYGCYLVERDIKERVGFIDIETSNLKANFGIILTWCIKPAGAAESEILRAQVTKAAIKRGEFDKQVVAACLKAMRGFDRLVGHYSTKFDIPYIRTRALIHKLGFPTYGEIKHTDTYYMAKSKLALHSNRQDAIAEALLGKTVKTRIHPNFWIQGLQGDMKALEYIMDHNIKDVIDLEQNYNKLVKFVKLSARSI